MEDIAMNGSNFSNSVWESAVPPSLQFAFGVIGNTIALIVLVCTSTSHKWQTFYKLVGGLAITDGGGILLMYPPILARYATDFTFDFPNTLCAYNSFLSSFTILSSAMIVCAMSIDRCMAVYFPFHYNSERGDRKRAVVMLIAIWTVGGLISSLHLMGLGSVYYFYPGSWCFLNFISDNTLELVDSFIYSGVGFTVLLVTVFLNVSVIAAFVRDINHTDGHLQRVKKDVYNVIFLSVIVVVSSLCWTPLMWRIFSIACKLSHENQDLELLVLRLAVTNSIIDPWIYILLRKETVQYLHRKVVRCKGAGDHNQQRNKCTPPNSELSKTSSHPVRYSTSHNR